MKKFVRSVIFVTCIFSFKVIIVTHGAVFVDETVMYSAEIVAALQRHFYAGCVYLLQWTDEIKFDSRDSLMLAKIRKSLVDMNIQTAVIPIQELECCVQCARNRPLYVTFISNRYILQEMATRTNSTNARWLSFLPETISLEDVFTDIYIPLDCEFLIAQSHETVVELTEVYRIHFTFPLEMHRVGSWSHVNGLQWTSTYILKRRSNLRGLVLRAITSHIEPGTILKQMDNGQYLAEGYLGKLWSSLEQRMNFSTQYSKPIADWGIELSGNWTGMIGVVTRKEADVAVAAFSMSSFRTSAVDYLSPFMIETQMLFFRNQDTFWPNLTAFLSPLKLWSFVASALIFLAVGLSITSFLAHRHGGEGPYYYSVSDSILCVFGSFCSQGQGSTPKSWSCRTVFLTSYLVGVVLLAAYSAALVSQLAVKRTVLPFESLQQLLDDGTYKFYIPAGDLLTYYRNSTSAKARSIYQKAIAPIESSLPSLKDGIKLICVDPKFVFMMSSYVLYAMEKRNELECNIMAVPQSAIPDVLCYIITKGSPYKKILSYNLQEMKYNGQIQRMKELYWYRNLHDPEGPKFGVTMSIVAPIFVIWAIGIFIAVLLLLCEKGRRMVKSKLKWLAYQIPNRKKSIPTFNDN